MTTTSLKHIVSNVENIRNPVITHCYYGNLLLLSGLCFHLLLFPSVLCAFIFVPFFCNRCLFLVFTTHISFSVFVRPLILVALRFAYRHLDPLPLSAFYLFSKHVSRDPINGMRMLFAPGVLSPFFFISSFLSISSSWYAVLDTNGDETVCRVLTSFRNQSSRFLSHQYHLGGMRL